MTGSHKLKKLLALCLVMVFSLMVFSAKGGAREIQPIFDLDIKGSEVITHNLTEATVLMVFEERLSISAGRYKLSGGKAVIRIEAEEDEDRGKTGYLIYAYLCEKVRAKGTEPADLYRREAEDGRAVLLRFRVPGQVLLTAEKRINKDPTDSGLYKKANDAVTALKDSEKRPARIYEKPGAEQPPVKEEKEFRYPIHIAPLGKKPLEIHRTREPDGTYIATVIARFYLWQKQEEDMLLELRADNAVIWFSEKQERKDSNLPAGTQQHAFYDYLAGGSVSGVYLCGDVVMREGDRTIRAQELYYDFRNKNALAIKAEMKNYSENRKIPIYLRADKIKKLAQNQFSAENVTLTNSEFHIPQISLNASKIMVTDNTTVDSRKGSLSKNSYKLDMRDIRLNMYEHTFFYWPRLAGNLQRPDVPIKRAHIGYDSDYGLMTETQWYLARLLGLPESENVESTFSVDYYTERGLGSGLNLEYANRSYYGRTLGYIIDDHGEDDLGRDESRKNLEPPRELRGRFLWQHRQFLPYDWQLTSEFSYLSDEHFLESFYREEFYGSKRQETLLHLKRIQDNQGLSILAKGRINDFTSELEELPSLEYHLIGESLWDDKFTFYNDTLIGRFRERTASDSSNADSEFFTFFSERAEIDFPVKLGSLKILPFAAGTAAYDDGPGFRTNIEGQTIGREDDVYYGELGTRLSTQYWKVYPQITSRLWDVNGLRHIVQPHLTTVGYAQSDAAVEQRDIFTVGLSQRLQTSRGRGQNERTMDWMRLDIDLGWVNDSSDTSAGPDRMIWNKPFIPLMERYSSAIPPTDRRAGSYFGPSRNYLGADYSWRLSDTTAVLSDMNYDLQSGVLQQLNLGFAQMRWPDLSYYVGSRYLRRLRVMEEKGSNALTFAATYKLDPRYTLVVSEQYDFDYAANIRSEISLIRRYHRLFWGLTFSADESLDRQSIIFSIWPQGVPETALGSRRYLKLGRSGYY